MKKVFNLFICPLLGLAAIMVSAQGADKITICHIPQDDPTNPDTITVSVSALPAHLAHGDTLGECDAACASDGGLCDTPSTSSSECCSSICSGEGICASNCTIGPEVGGDPCSFELPCCPVNGPSGGVCIGGFCEPDPEVMCALLNETCDIFGDPPTFCCFNYSCSGGVCVEP